MTNSDQRRLLIDLMAPGCTPDAARLVKMDESDWIALLTIARQHRVLPLLHARLRSDGADWPVPDDVREACAMALHKHSFANMRAQRTLVLAVRVLSAAGIGSVAMKGAYLAFHAYGEAGLRPLRDIDLLVAESRAVEAYRLLCANGFAPVKAESGDAAALLAVKHQLPSLICQETGTHLELHHRAFHGGAGDPDLTDNPNFAGLWVRHRVGDATIAYMGLEDLLLHLIVHSAHDHRFDNGPGIFADVAALTTTHTIDWSRFWDSARRYACERAALLVLRLAQRDWAVAGIDWGGHTDAALALSDAMLDDAALLTLRDPANSAELARLTRIDGRRGALAKARFVLAKLVPSPTMLRAAYPNRGRRRELPGLYVRKWRDLAADRLPSYVATLRSTPAGSDRERLARLGDWLGTHEHDH